MKAKPADRSLVTRPIRATQGKESILVAGDPLLRPRPFLAQTLRLRMRPAPRE